MNWFRGAAAMLACLLMILGPADAIRPPVMAGGSVEVTSTHFDSYDYSDTSCSGDGELNLLYSGDLGELAWHYGGNCSDPFPQAYVGRTASCTGDYRQRLECTLNEAAPSYGEEIDFHFTLEFNGAFTMHYEYRYWGEDCDYYCYRVLDTEHIMDLSGKLSRIDTQIPHM